ncbi:DUF6093 family protein [Streptomyces jeddahensis]|uniref:DUF6093 family protein n=1 Tax=Streptomyces jeddahensis TaxID=1716141 RepID=UPI0038CD4055
MSTCKPGHDRLRGFRGDLLRRRARPGAFLGRAGVRRRPRNRYRLLTPLGVPLASREDKVRVIVATQDPGLRNRTWRVLDISEANSLAVVRTTWLDERSSPRRAAWPAARGWPMTPRRHPRWRSAAPPGCSSASPPRPPPSEAEGGSRPGPTSALVLLRAARRRHGVSHRPFLVAWWGPAGVP